MAESWEPQPNQSRAQAFFQYGNDAAMKNNFDYAIDMYRNALKLDQGNLLYRQALRGVQRRVFGNDPGKVGRMVGMKTKPMKAGLQASRARGKWIDMLEGAEDIFRLNPWDVGAADYASDAAEHLGLMPLALWLLESVASQAGENEGFFLRLAHGYELNQKWEQSIACWEKAHRINPANEEAKRKVRALSASASIARSGLGAALEKHNEPGGFAQAAAAEADELKRTILTPEQRLEKEIEEDPSRVGPYLQLADLHKQYNRLDDAEKVLARGRKANPDDEVLKTAHGDVQLARLRRAIDAWTKKVKENPGDAEGKEKLAQLREKLSAYELAEYRRRAEAHPADAALQLQYGRLLLAAGKPDEAIAAFQKARSDADLKPKALHQAGLAFRAKGLVKLAEKNVAEALALSDARDTAFGNELRYELGCLCEAQGKFKEAEEFFNEVAAEDYTYKDVAARLQALNSRDES